MKHGYSLIMVVLLTGCQSVSLQYAQTPYEVPPVGTTLQLHEELIIPAGEASVMIQDGAVQPSTWRLNQYRPHCDFELNSVADTARRVPPQIFTVTRALRDYENVMRDQPVRLAGRERISGVLGAREGNGPPLENNMLIMYLRAETDIDVLRMTCQVWIDAATDEAITIADVRGTLGELFTLKLPGAGTR
ncbi:MAG: hypothetical protein PVF75_06695 [Granulosicoccaceae bacterium]|jgi:hypothetical protein